jgi:hypothetical protein
LGSLLFSLRYFVIAGIVSYFSVLIYFAFISRDLFSLLTMERFYWTAISLFIIPSFIRFINMETQKGRGTCRICVSHTFCCVCDSRFACIPFLFLCCREQQNTTDQKTTYINIHQINFNQ